jgi:DNA-binding winged helix-turn-helix (wHTH) protein/Tfp pilus assembly protein PilF/TolB-like protein
MEPAVSSAQVFRFGLFEADVVRNVLTRNGTRIKIQDQPFRVLTFLLERPGEIVTRDELRPRLWPEGTYVDFDGSLNVILKKLRAALDDNPDNPRFIETVPRRGYRFIAPVAANVARSETASTTIEPALELQPAEVAPSEGTAGSRQLFTSMYAVGGLVLIILAGTVWLGWQRIHHAANPSIAPSPAASVSLRKSVAVLGFRNVSGRAEDAWMATAFSEMLSTELAGGEQLRLVPGEDVANLRISSPWPQTDTLDRATTARINGALNSDLLVLGSYTTIEKSERARLRLDIRLQDARTGEILAELAETGGSQDLFRLVASAGAKLRDRVGVPRLEELDQAGVLAALPLDPEGSRFYALGLTKLRHFDFSAAKDLLIQASHADPKFSLAHAMLGRAWGQLGYQQKCKEEAKKAFELSTDLPRAERMLVEGDYYESLNDHEKAASTYRALFELFPDSVDYGLSLAQTQMAAGHASEALQTIARLRQLSAPLSADPRIDLAEGRMRQSKVESLQLIRKSLASASSRGETLIYARARKEECMMLIYGDHPDTAIPSCEEAYNVFMTAGNRLDAADALRLIGDRRGYAGHYDQAIATYQRALAILEGLGDHEKIGAVLNNMAIDVNNEGRLDQAEALYQKAKTNFELAGDKRNTGVVIANIADILYLRGNLAEAAKLYKRGVAIEATADPSEPGYYLTRLADLELAEGRIQDAHRLAEQALASFQPEHGNFQGVTGAMTVLAETMEAEGDLVAARKQCEQALALREKVGAMDLVAESHVELGEMALLEGHPEMAEPLVRAAIAEFEKENGLPDASSAYVVLSRALLMQGKVESAREALRRATELGSNTSDPALKLSIAIHSGRLKSAYSHPGRADADLKAAKQQLRAAAAKAEKLGYYLLECEARLALGELEMRLDPPVGRAMLSALATESHNRGLGLLASMSQEAMAPGTNRPKI